MIYMIFEDLMNFDDYDKLIQYGILCVLFGLGGLFIYTGKVETTIFDKRKDLLII